MNIIIKNLEYGINHKPVFFTSDWHLGHENCLKFDKRPFNNIDHMHEVLIKNYNSIVPDNGICYFLGDMGNKTEDIRKVVSRLNGTKVLIWGNHDKGINTMYNCGFDVVLLSATILVHKTPVTLSHCPLNGIFREDTSNMKGHDPDNPEYWHGSSREKHQLCTVPNDGQFHLHGHIHSRPDKNVSVKILDKQYDVGVPANNYKPVSIYQIESWIYKYKNNLEEE